MKDQNIENDNQDWLADVQNWNWTDKDKIYYYTSMRAASFNKTLMFQAEGNKALMYINGGAAVATLAFCGNYIGQIDWWAIAAILCFSIGAFVSIIIFYSAYNAQKNYTNLENINGDRCISYSTFFIGFAAALFVLGIFASAFAINELQNKNAHCEMLKK